MGFRRLEETLIDLVKEQQATLGYGGGDEGAAERS